MTFVLPLPTSPPVSPLPRVLVVDDDRDAADMLAQLLCLHAIDARPAFGGRQALELASSFDPHVIFLDLGMPGMDGYEVIYALRRAGSTAHIVALTAWDDARTLANVARAGFDRHMAKPSSLPAILLVVAAHGGAATRASEPASTGTARMDTPPIADALTALRPPGIDS